MKEMKRLVASTILGTCILAGGRADAQVFEKGPLYPYPSWDQQLPASTRFVVLTNWASQAVLDRETGLVWERAPAIQSFLWALAFLDCRRSAPGNRFGWRLPTEEELATLLDPTQSNLSLPAGHPFQLVAASDEFWTASTDETATFTAYTISFTNANAQLHPLVANLFTDSRRRWCVRGGSSAPNPSMFLGKTAP